MYGYETFHDELTKNLIKSVHKGTSSHAYVFEGEKGLGKLNAARLFAAALTCANTYVAPCGECSSCIEAKANSNPDIIYVRPKKDKKSIGADDMRALEEDAAVKPFGSGRKVYIFEDGTQLTEAAQNTFLKTFEEPPEYAVFIIVISNTASLLQTIMSRCTLVHFPCVKDSIVETYIRENFPEASERIPFLVKYCGGVPKKADSVMSDTDFETLRSASLEKLSGLLSIDRRSAFSIRKFLEENKDKAEQILDFWLSFTRDTVLIQTGAMERIINVDKRDMLRQTASGVNPEKIIQMTDRLLQSQKMLGRYVSIKALSMWLALS